jgi:hypothetical protein
VAANGVPDSFTGHARLTAGDPAGGGEENQIVPDRFRSPVAVGLTVVGLLATLLVGGQAGAQTPPATTPTTVNLLEDLVNKLLPTTTVAPAPPTTAAPAPAPAPQPVATGSGYNDPANPAAWDRLAQCESGGNWAANTGNGYYGGIQFSLSSWQAAGGAGRPDQASRETQIAIGQRLWHQGGWVHWPACSAKLGYR